MNLTFNKIFIIFTLLYVLFFVKTWGGVSGNIYSHDDVVYYAQAASLINDLDLDIKNNLGQYSNIYLQTSAKTGRIMSYQPLGPTLLYIIPYALTKPVVCLISMMRGVAFDQYDPLFFVVLCSFIFLLFYLSGQVMRKGLGLFFEQSVADITVIFTLWGTILPVYVFRRPIFGVIPEFFTVTLLVYYLIRAYKKGSISIPESAIAGATTGLFVITRWNDVYLIPFTGILIIYLISKKCNFYQVVIRLSSFICFFGIFCAFQLLAWLRTYGSTEDFLGYYYKLHAQYISSQNTVLTYARNLLHIFFGIDWGIIFTMPVLFFGGVAFMLNPRLRVFKHKVLDAALAFLTFWACFYVVLQWKNTGEFYGYRFLVSLLPFSAIGFAALTEKGWIKYRKAIIYAVLFYCVFNFFIILPFEFTEKTTMLPNMISSMGGRGWGNNHYFINALRFYFESGIKNLIAAFSRGYLAALVFGVLSICGVDLARFGPKVAGYFVILSYKSYVVFIYPLLMCLCLYLGKTTIIRRDKNE